MSHPCASRIRRHGAAGRVHGFLAAVLALSALTACGGVQIKPEPKLPDPVIQKMPARIGLVVPPEMRNYVHKETRWGVNWQVDLGPGHTALVKRFFGSLFDEVVEFTELEEARGASGLKAVFEPRIEQYSFVTARETGGRYYAVTIRYRINLYTPDTALADSYTLTGYGNALAKGLSSGKPLQQATLAAMRDAAAKFLVQFPEQPAGKLLAANEPVVAEPKTASVDEITGIEAVPINEPQAQRMPPAPPSTPVPSPSVPTTPGTEKPAPGTSGEANP